VNYWRWIVGVLGIEKNTLITKSLQ
jgi:hypothetical protein